MAILFDGNTPIQGVTAIDDTIIMSGYEYSEDEICVGCWTNGKPIYRKTVQTTSPTSADTYTSIYRIDNTMEIINFYGCLKDDIEGTTFPLNHYRNNTYYSWTIKTNSGIDMVVGGFNNYFINKPVYLTIEYTKTTDAENSFTVDMLYKTQTPFTGAELISDAYNPNSTYAVGDFCIHDNKLYKCNTAIAVAEAWNSAHWTETKIDDELGSGSSSGLDTFGIDTSRLITTFSSSVEGTSYTATEDCYVVGELVGYQEKSSIVYIDNVQVFSTYNQNSASANVMYCPLKSGQTIKITAASSTFIRTMSVYGAIKESVNSTIYLPSIYSEEEKQIGVWEDGKPLYQKTFEVDNPVNETEFDVDANVDTMVRLCGAFIDHEGTVLDISSYLSQNYHIGAQYLPESNKVKFQIVYLGGLLKAYVTLQYTKTTDTPGSGIWTPQGVPAVHYSTDEQVIGTWVDGKTLYRQVHVFDDPVTIPLTTWTHLSWYPQNVDMVISCSGWSITDVGKVFQGDFLADNLGNIQAQRNSMDASVKYICFEYTKTTD